MKRLLILLTILIALGAVAYFLKPQNEGQTSSIDTSDRKFAIPADQISKFTIKKIENGDTRVFEKRSGGQWYINDKYKVSQFVIPQLLGVFEKITIQNIPSKAETKAIIKNMKEVGLQVKIYDLNGKEARSYRIGLNSFDDSGTGFLMDGAAQPYNMYMKGFDGDLRSRFGQIIDNYRDRELFAYEEGDIKSIKVKYHKDQKSSFSLTMNGRNAEVKPLSQFIAPSTKKINQDNVNAYLGDFTRVYAEDFDNYNSRKDTILTTIPWATVSVENKEGKINEIDFFPFRDLLLKNANTVELAENTKIERFFSNKTANGRSDFLVCQNRNVKRIFRGYDFFLEK